MNEDTLARARHQFADPPREYGVMPFWFWNDDLDEESLIRQINEFHAKGFGGFIPHARVGLSRRVGYLTDEYFHLLRLCVVEAARLGMKVVLYDEGSYPSGSAQGRVVAENPEYAARCLIHVDREIEGPASGFWRPNPGRALKDELVCVVLARQIAPHTLDPETFSLLEADAHEVVRYDVGEGTWRIVSCWNVFSGGAIRGVFAEEEDGHALAPAAGDILNPDAVAAFIRATHDAYYDHLKHYFGTTIVAMFTDEPSVMGRGPRRGPDPRPFTDGFLDDLSDVWDQDVRLWLPALWYDCGERGTAFRATYKRAVEERLGRVFYQAQHDWCEKHGIALTGHPATSDDLGSLRYFQWPGQDMVWRYVEPGKPSALEGQHSVAAKGPGSVAAIDERPRNTSEVLGAYGWNLTLDETKWLFDWHLVRGNNTFFPHACFYSIRGRRAYESEPDIGAHNVWWPYFGLIGDYVRRASWLLSDGVQVNEVAVLTDPHSVAWRAAKVLYQNQIGFVYTDDAALARATVAGNVLRLGSQDIKAVVLDPPVEPSPGVRRVLTTFRKAGGLLIEKWDDNSLLTDLKAGLEPDIAWPGAPTLRALHYRRSGLDIWLLVNEGETAIEGDASVRGTGLLEIWDPLLGTTRVCPSQSSAGRTMAHLRLERRQALALVLDPTSRPVDNARTEPVPGEIVLQANGPWRARDACGRVVDVVCPGDWAQQKGWELYSGTLTFRTEFTLTPELAERAVFLDLGEVGDIAEVTLNAESVGVRAWAPYILAVDGLCRSGENGLVVRVTNSMDNAYNGSQRPSGLLGPITMRAGRL